MKYSVNLFEQRKLFESIIRSGTRTHYPHRQLVSPQSPKTDAHKRSWMAYPKKPPKSTPVNIPTAHPATPPFNPNHPEAPPQSSQSPRPSQRSTPPPQLSQSLPSPADPLSDFQQTTQPLRAFLRFISGPPRSSRFPDPLDL